MFEYHPKPLEILSKEFKLMQQNDENDFESFGTFISWYAAQTKHCFYCGLTEMECQEVVMTGILRSKKFPKNQQEVEAGNSTGVWLELDKLNPMGKHSMNNSVLCCYFCKNDKADIFGAIAYPNFSNNRLGYLRSLLTKIHEVQN